MSENLEWVKAVVAVLGPLATITAAGVAAWVAITFGKAQRDIAHRQAETAANKLKLDLFDKRYNAYRKAKTLITSIQLRWDDNGVSYTEFLEVCYQGKFLFGDDVSKVFSELRERGAKWIVFVGELQRNKDGIGEVEVATTAAARTELRQLMKWASETEITFDTLFLKYLDFRKVL